MGMARRPVVQLSLDLVSIDEALRMARMAVEVGVDWLEAGTPLILAEGMHSVRALHRAFPDHPVVADLKIMDGGGLETRLAAEAGASWVVVMGRAHDATVRAVVREAHGRGVRVMGDVLGSTDYGAEAARMEALGVDAVIAHLGFDERGEHPEASVFDFLGRVVSRTRLPVQAVGGIRIEDLAALPRMGAPLVVVGAPLVISAEAFAPAADDMTLRQVLRQVVQQVHAGGLIGSEGGLQ